MRIIGFQKTTLLDYPHKLASTIFLSGCNLRCPFCHNADLVIRDCSAAFTPKEVLAQLKKRSNILEGVCITGGEPTLNADLPQFLSSIKELGLSIKLDTNGTNPSMVRTLLRDHLIDYIAMDIKNSPENYEKTAGVSLSLDAIYESMHLLMESALPYEFRTTVVKELHSERDFIAIGEMISGAKQYYLQNFVDSGNLVSPNHFSSYTKTELDHFVMILKQYVSSVSLRGIDF